MKNTFKIFTLAALMVFATTASQAQKIHAILCGATSVADIGKGCQSSLDLMENALTYIGTQTGMEVEFTLLTGSDFVKDKIETTISDIDAGEDDVIFFYSTSHGFNYNNRISRFTFIGAHPTKIEMTKSELNKFGLSLEKEVYQPLMNKNARLTVAMAEACNTIVDIPAPSTYNAMNVNISKRLKELFLEAKGSAISTSSSLDQRSWTDPEDGGIYTNMFIEAMNDIISSKDKATWKNVFDKTESMTVAYADKEGLRGGQRPDSEVNFHDVPIKLKEEGKDEKETADKKKKHDYIAPKIKVVKKEEKEDEKAKNEEEDEEEEEKKEQDEN
jgi:hypothetical protein